MAHILNSHQQHDSFQLPAHLRGHRMLSLSASQWLAPLWLPTLTAQLLCGMQKAPLGGENIWVQDSTQPLSANLLDQSPPNPTSKTRQQRAGPDY